MPKAVWNGVVLAESDETVMVEGNHYFPPKAVNREYFRDSQAHTTCYWKGVASYYDIEVEGGIAAVYHGHASGIIGRSRRNSKPSLSIVAG